MPARPRKQIVDEDGTGFYHCYSRCVRRAFLCGEDAYTGKNYDHRKRWVEERLDFLAAVMAVQFTAHAILDNHLHVICRIRPDLARKWSDEEVARRWLTVCPGKREKNAARPSAPPTEEQIQALLANTKKLAKCRRRLSSLSWTMKFLKENLARRANEEDGCGGAFFESRFRSTRLLDLFAVLLCTMYVDLNPIRAGKAKTPESSSWTSVFWRIVARQARRAKAQPARQKKTRSARDAAAWLAPIEEDASPPDGAQAQRGRRVSDQGFLPMSLEKYLTLLDWFGRQLRRGKRGAIPAHLAPILQRLEVDVDHYLEGLKSFGIWFSDFAGSRATLLAHAAASGGRWLRGVGTASV